MVTQEQINEIIKEIVENFKPQKVILFGSYANGTPTEELVYHQIYFPKTHRIMDLLELCATKDSSFKDELEDADNLTD